MLIENAFDVPAPPDRLWGHLLDVERVAACVPGAELTEIVDDTTWKGRMSVKFGPVAMAFAGTVTMVERDDEAHRVVLKARGTESKGKGAASADVTSWLEPGDRATTVKVHADITLQGFVAQVSRGMLPDISTKLTRQFADCLAANMRRGDGVPETTPERPPAHGPPAEPEASAGGLGATPAPPGTGPGVEREAAARPAGAAAAPPAKDEQARAAPIAGLRLAMWALLRAIGRAVRRAVGRLLDWLPPR
jgi:carbon monoxide dehydrogenase subunit G